MVVGYASLGEDFTIRERLEHVLFVDVESMEIVERG